MLRDGEEIELKATPEVMEQEDALGNKVKVGVIGVVNSPELGQPRIISYSVPGALVEAVRQTGHSLERTWNFLKRFAVGREDKCQLGGPIKIAKMSGQAANLGFEMLVQLVAGLSLGIGFLNLLPIPPLDGGHLVFYAVEAAHRASGIRAGDGNGLSRGISDGARHSWGSFSGTISLDVEFMKELGFAMTRIETAFTIAADMRDPNVTLRALVNTN